MARTGSFAGHALPGTFFIIYGLWWTFHTVRLYIIQTNTKYYTLANKSPTSAKCSRCLYYVLIKKAQLLEGIVKFLAALVGALIEATSADWEMVDDRNRFHGQNDWHHVTMYLFFGFSGMVDILSQTCLRLAPGRDKLYLSMAFAAEGFLFYLHSNGGKPLDATLHKLLVLAIFGCALSTFLEMWLVREKFLPFFRVAFTLLQGTWFYQIAFTLFDPRTDAVRWNEDNGVNVAFIVMAFTWHCIGVVTFINIAYGLVFLFYRCRYGKAETIECDQHNITDNNFELVIENQKLLNNESQKLLDNDTDNEAE